MELWFLGFGTLNALDRLHGVAVDIAEAITRPVTDQMRNDIAQDPMLKEVTSIPLGHTSD